MSHYERTTHIRMSLEDQEILNDLKKDLQVSESEVIRKSFRDLHKRRKLHKKTKGKTAYELAGDLCGIIKLKTHDLATNKKHMEGYGEDRKKSRVSY